MLKLFNIFGTNDNILIHICGKDHLTCFNFLGAILLDKIYNILL